jgi:glutathione S-transferase
MRLYHVPNTRGSRVIWMLEEAGVPYELVPISREDARTPEHLARHPLGKVPVLEDDEGCVIESAAHILHVADLRPDAGLIAPPGTHERALAYQWVFFATSELEPQAREFLAGRDSDPDRAAVGKERYLAAAQVVEDALDGQEYLVADRFGAADVVVSANLFLGKRLDLLDGLPSVEAYLARLDERPARKRALELASA